MPLWVHETFNSSGVNLLPRARRAGEVAPFQPLLPTLAHAQLAITVPHVTALLEARAPILRPAPFTCWHSLMERSTVAANPPVPSPQPQHSVLCFTPGSCRSHLHPTTPHGPHHFLFSIQIVRSLPPPSILQELCMAVRILQAWHGSGHQPCSQHRMAPAQLPVLCHG